MMTREEMLNDVIRKFGFEAPETIRFAEAYETYDSEYLLDLFYGVLMAKQIDDEEE